MNLANGSLTADLGNPPAFSFARGGEGLSDTWIQPANRRNCYADIWVVTHSARGAHGKILPAQAISNVGSILNNFATGIDLYVCVINQPELGNELVIHGQQSGDQPTTPGQKATASLGIWDKFSYGSAIQPTAQLLGEAGCDQRCDGEPVGLTASIVSVPPVHAVGVQSNLSSSKGGAKSVLQV